MTHARRELLLRKADSIARQTLPRTSFEWVVVVNGDADGTAAALYAWRLAEPEVRVRVLHRETNGPIGAARNRAAEVAAAELLYLSDDDCLLAPDTLQRHASCQEGRPGVWLGPIVFRTEDGDEPWSPRAQWWSLNGANASLPAAAWHAVGGFDERLQGYGGEDLLLGYRLQKAGLAYGVCAHASVVHVGPNPVRGADLDKARQAGLNAARIAERHPELAGRLGVHPWLLALKRLVYDAPWSSALRRIAGGRFGYEQAYYRGAVEHRETRKP